ASSRNWRGQGESDC
ncbi:hypothetical protein CLOM_g9568, partial [Closterium sp. NIES-68]